MPTATDVRKRGRQAPSILHPGYTMSEASGADVNLLCSKCYTPTPLAEAHVIPTWNPAMGMVVTTYRCNNCWLSGVAEMRALVSSGDEAAQLSLCDFIVRQGYTDVDMIRNAPADQRKEMLLKVLDALEAGRITFHP
ncbi:MAG TPA: hypothetical protein VEI06_00050 [Gemmatimonadaceae bacterium]|nr:hypothetical protein [Gemmatimonadaceae bacterium]